MRVSSFILARALVLAAALALVWASVATAAVWTDQPDYAPGDTVTISGDNSNFAEGEGYLPGETVHVDVSGPNGWNSTCDAVTDDAGAWSCQVTLSDGAEAVGEYQYTATGLASGTTEGGTFTDQAFFLRAKLTGTSTYIAVEFPGDPLLAGSSIRQFNANSTCTDPPTKWRTTDITTPTTGGYANVTGGIGTITGNSIEVEAPSPVTIGGATYYFDSWTVDANGSVTTVGTTGCFSGWNATIATQVTANYIYSDLTATKTNDTTNDFAQAGESFEWTIHVENEGNADADFATGEVILLDELTSGPTYDNLLWDDSNLTGDVDCDLTSDVITCTADGAVTFEPGDYLDVTFDVTPGFDLIGTTIDNPASGETCAVDPEDKVDEGDETNNDCADSVDVTAIVVTRGACTFDLYPNDIPTFRNIFTPDMYTSDYKLFATNPGQFFLNVATYIGEGEDVTIELPFPFVTQGAVPIKVYGDWTATEDNGKWCFEPFDLLWSQTDQVTLSNPDYNQFDETETLVIDPPAPDFTGWVWIRIHIDYGLKGITTGCMKEDIEGSGGDAINCDYTVEEVGFVDTISDPMTYEFSFTDAAAGSTEIESQNEFKRINGVAGLVLGVGGEPVAGATIQVWQGSTLWKTVFSDEDGWYMALFKYHGKATTFTVQVIELGVQQSFTLKSNGFAVANFIDGVTTWEFITATTTSTDSGSTDSGGGGGKGKGPNKI